LCGVPDNTVVAQKFSADLQTKKVPGIIDEPLPFCPGLTRQFPIGPDRHGSNRSERANGNVTHFNDVRRRR